MSDPADFTWEPIRAGTIERVVLWDDTSGRVLWDTAWPWWRRLLARWF